MTEPKRITLTSDMTYSQARAVLAEAWPQLPVMFYRPSLGFYKEGWPPATEFELGHDEPLLQRGCVKAEIHGEMSVQTFHSTMMKTFSLETEVLGRDEHSIWTVSLDDADSGVRRSR